MALLPRSSVPSTDVQIVVSANVRDATRGFELLGQRTNRLRLNTDRLRGSFRSLDRFWGLLVSGSAAALIIQFTRMAAEMQKVQFQIAAFTRDFDKVPQQMNRIITLAKQVPFDIEQIAKTFVRLKAAGLDPIIDDQGNGPLKNLLDAVSAFGGGTDILVRAGVAIQQMAGKGVISMEELRQQLGEAVPTAMRIMAQQMGKSVGEMIAIISKGELEFQEGFSALDKGFRESFGGLGAIFKQTFAGQIQEVSNQLKVFGNTLVDAGVLDVMAAGLLAINGELSQFNVLLRENAGTVAKDFIDWLVDAAPKIDQFIDSVIRFGSALIDIGSIIGTLLGSLPAEVLAFGLIGFLIAGRMGLAVGGLVGLLETLPASIKNFTDSILSSIPPVIKNIGIVGLLLFGNAAVRIATAIAVLTTAVKKVFDEAFAFSMEFRDRIFNLVGKTGGLLWDFIFGTADVQKFKDEVGKIFDGIDESVRARQKKDSELRSKGLKQLLGFVGLSGLVGEAEKSGDAAGKGFVTKMAEGMAKGTDIVRKANELLAQKIAIEDVGGFTESQQRTFERLIKFQQQLEIQADSAGSAVRRINAKTRIEVKALTKIIDDLTAKLSDPKTEFSKFAGIRAAIKDTQDLKDNILRLTDVVVNKLSGNAAVKLESQLTRLRVSMRKFGGDSEESLGTIEKAVRKVDSQFAGFQRQLDQIKAGLDKGIADPALRARIKSLVDVTQNELTQAFSRAREEAEKFAGIKLEKKLAALENRILSLSAAVRMMQLDVAFDEVGKALLQASERTRAAVNQINQAIANIRADPDILAADADEMIAHLERIKTSAIEAGEKLKERAAFNASEYGKFINTISQKLEDSLVDGLEGFVNGTKSAKDVLLDFYASITRAAAQYIVKQMIMKSLFGTAGSGSTGGGFTTFISSLFGGGAQRGGQAIVGGVGGADSQPVNFMATPGEKITVTPPGMSGGEGGALIGVLNISAVDSRGVEKLFLENGSTLVRALQSRMRLGDSI